MMRTYTLLFASLLCASSALAQSLGEKTGADSILDLAPDTPNFVTEVANSDKFEIEASKLAQQQADASTKSFASEMVADHRKTSKQLKSLISSGKVTATLPAVLDSEHDKMLNDLKALKGSDFTKKYQDEQVSAHKEAVSLFERYAKNGDNADLKGWAAKTLPTLQHHLQMAQTLDKSGA